MKKTTLLLLFTILCLFSCQTGEKEKTVEFGNVYSISIPSFLTKVNDLNEDASIQYCNKKKEFYVIAINESKSEIKDAIVENNLTEQYSDDLEGYYDLVLGGYEENIDILKKSEVTDTFINNMPAKLQTVSARFSSVDIFYSFAYIEGKEQYYQIITWTLQKNENKYKNEMEKIIYSLQELYN